MWGKRPDSAGESDFKRRVAAMSERKWNAVQIAGGLLLGVAAASCLTMDGGSGSSIFLTVYALLLALLALRMLERLCGRRVGRGRVAMIAALAAVAAARLALAG